MRVANDLELSELEVSNDTKVLLQELMKRKGKYERYKFLNTLVSIVNLLLAALFVLWLLRMTSSSSQNVLAAFTSSGSLAYIGLMIGLLIGARMLNDKYKKTKEKYEDLRKETITKLDADWELMYSSDKRDRLSKWFSAKDINIRYKS